MPPFSKEAELVHDYDPAAKRPTTATLPDYPLVKLNDPSQIRKFLEQELWCRDLEAMAPRLWMMTTFSGANINPLHRQRVKGREIVVTEEPRLHLVWIHNRIFVKPLPRYLLSQAFWKTFLEEGSDRADYSQSDLCKAATGFLRTYRYLIQHESDFCIAQQAGLRLVPKGIDWLSFCRLISELSHVDDAAVSQRYCYGELRLTRLNFYAPLLLRKFHFEQVHGQYGDFFGRLYGPLLFVFAIVSTILNSMQVALAADQLEASHWEAVWHVSRYFSMVSLVGVAIISLWFILLWLWIFLDEWIYTAGQKLAKKREAQSTPC
ncbi:hypothetical protein DPSP01_000138 [Paraphaeosphaeria sporulosa]|uniref:Subtilisin-like serine protease n=1 Tax=Paraphaeosphaeria sporulosa TaxID=1460663 RepID=A0A177CZJ8_9PLEO|nr:uncharacterized protein CC84DRAFT_1160179 [Paraphaeosphaeria sporulosa]OAG12934.1 hypothetical protein CC84DRAFT_1160179 [Paraphaeosphaeria sporulosa]